MWTNKEWNTISQIGGTNKGGYLDDIDESSVRDPNGREKGDENDSDYIYLHNLYMWTQTIDTNWWANIQTLHSCHFYFFLSNLNRFICKLYLVIEAFIIVILKKSIQLMK
jgi:hypothetical protein